jgi:glycosyltransferase 2 family protein
MKPFPWHKGIQWILLLLALWLAWWTVRSAQWNDIVDVLQRLTPVTILFLVLANLLVLVTLSGRWWIFLVGSGYRIPFGRLLGYRVAAFAVSYFTPGPHVGGEPLQVYLVNKYQGVPAAVAIATVTLDKLLEMAINFVVLGAGILLIIQQQVLTGLIAHRTLYVTLGLVLLPLPLLSALWLGRHPLADFLAALHQRHPWHNGTMLARVLTRVAGWLQTLRQSKEEIRLLWHTTPSVFLGALLISLVSWAALIGEFWYMTYALGLGLTFPQAITLLLAMRVAILLPMPAGLGVLEAGLAMATAALGLNPAAGLSLSLLIRLRDVVVGLVGLWLGGFALWRQKLPNGIGVNPE